MSDRDSSRLAAYGFGGPVEDKVSAVTAVVAAAQQYQQENTRQARRLLAGCVRECLMKMLGRKPTREEIGRTLRGEL